MIHRVPVAGCDICAAFREDRAGTPVFVNELRAAPDGFFGAEARGLDRLRAAGGPPVPEVVEVGPTSLVLAWVDAGPPSPRAAHGFGSALAALHAMTQESFGGAGFAATVPLEGRRYDHWAPFFAEARLLPLVRSAVDAGHLDRRGAAAIEQVCARLADLVPEEPPALLHGDLWSGNLVWGVDGRVWLVDAAAVHAGHRETDLALLHLFGAPFLPEVDRGYREARPLADGWESRLGVHQLHPLCCTRCCSAVGTERLPREWPIPTSDG